MTIIELFVKLLKFRSITPDDDGALAFICSYLSDFEAVTIDKEGVKNLLLTKKFGENPLHIAFAGHIDVVPAGEGWQSEPFEPVVENGEITARGAQDMKSGVAAFLYTAKHLTDFDGTLSIILTSDEEGEGKYGTLEVLEYLKSRDFLPHYCVVAEPTCDAVFGDTIKIGRRGSINGVLKLFGTQGHAAYPQKSLNPIHDIASILPHLAGKKLDEGDEDFAPSEIVIVDIRAGMEISNVTPAELKLMFNVRNSTHTTKETIESYVHRLLKGKNYTLTLTQSALPFVTKRNSMLAWNMLKSIETVTNRSAELSTTGGTSDARYLAQYGVEVLEFGVVNDKIHALNESTKIEYVEKLSEIFTHLLINFK
jgi:succinyl-diaminopimelate desuccinylase